jgi:hypothetical protein
MGSELDEAKERRSCSVSGYPLERSPEATGDLKKRGMRLRCEPNQFQPKGQN